MLDWTMVDCTILLPNYNNEHVLPVMFEHLRRNADCGRARMIIVDDGSEDDGVRVAKEAGRLCGFAAFEIIETPHRGIVAALNDGLAACQTDYVFRIDGDATVMVPDWMDGMRDLLRRFPEIGMVSGQTLFYNGHVHSFGRAALGRLGLYDLGCEPAEPAGARTFDSLVHRPQRGYLDGPPYEVDTALGVCAAFRRQDAAAVGGFDLRFSPVWIEDDDFGLALRAIGKRVVIDPRVRVLHRTDLRGSRKPGTEAQRRASPVVDTPLSVRIRRRVHRAAAALVGRHSESRAPQAPFRETDPWRIEILKRHYTNWRDKWGFDPLNPDLDAIRERHWSTALCWQLNPERGTESRRFAEALAGVPGRG